MGDVPTVVFSLSYPLAKTLLKWLDYISPEVVEPGKLSDFTAAHQHIGGSLQIAIEAREKELKALAAREILNADAASSAANGEATGEAISDKPIPKVGGGIDSTPLVEED
jgi:hypothetical protein